MTEGVRTVIYPVKDLAAAKARFTGLIGEEPQQDAAYYVGWRVAGQDIGLDPHGHQQGMTAYWSVADIRGSLETLLASGATANDEVRDVGGGKLIVSVTDPDGNVIGLIQNP